jgi:uncharacterized protein (DUF2062 family)
MARHILKRFIPNAAAIKSTPALQFLGHLLHDPNLFHLNRRSVSMAFLVGIFIAVAIPLPGQMALAALAALYFRCNLPIAVALVWITNPVTIPFFFYIAYVLGCFVLQIPPNEFKIELTIQWFAQELERLLPPFLLGSFILGAILACIGYVSMQLYWRWNVNRNWQKRKLKRKQSN